MKQYCVSKSTLQGGITIPPSKSHTLRAILFASLAHGESTIRNYLPSPDALAMIEACQLLGANICISPEYLKIRGLGGKIQQAEDVINAGNSGIVLRFCSALAALGTRPIVITGDHSIRHQRPMQPLMSGLSQLGASAISTRGDHYAPIIVQGPMKEGQATILGEDSQHVSALLIAGAFASGPIELNVTNAGEKSWVALTLHWFDRLGIPYVNHKFEQYRMFGNASYEGFDYTVPGDFSSAAFPIGAALVTQSQVVIKNIDMRDPQGDKQLITVLQAMGAAIEIDMASSTLHVDGRQPFKGAKVDINNFVDAITILAVIACFAEGKTHIYNGSVARQKECNRIQCITLELHKMGADIEETECGLIIKKSTLKGSSVHSYQDHRMAMSLAVAGLGANGKTIISPVECVSKTFPTFLRDFTQIGANIQEW